MLRIADHKTGSGHVLVVRLETHSAKTFCSLSSQKTPGWRMKESKSFVKLSRFSGR
jgi:hypothetical protein